MIDDLNSEAAKIPSIGGLEGVTDPAVKKALLAIKETLEIYAGTRPRVSWLDKVLTNRDAFDYGVIGVVVNGQTVTGSNNGSVVSTSQPPAPAPAPAPALDLTPPGAPLGLIATGTKLAVLLEWSTPASTVAYTEIIRAAVDNIGLAVLIGTTSATIYADIIGATDVTNYYWIRFVSKNGVAGAYNSISGTMAVTGRLGSNDLISVDGAKIIDATILNAKIANVSADKITTGTLAVGQAIQVGAAANRIFIDGSGIIRSGGMLDYLNGNGFYLRATLGSAQFGFGNASTYIGFNGTDIAIQTPNFSLTNSNLTFNGNGTFSGNLSAVNGTLANLTILSNGSISSGQSAFNTGSGFHLSNAAGVSKFSVGSPTRGLTWDGVTATINGDLIGTGNIQLNGVSITSSAYTAGQVEGTTAHNFPPNFFIVQSVTIIVTVASTVICLVSLQLAATECHLLRNGVSVYGRNVFNTTEASFNFSETLAAGTYTYAIGIVGGGGFGPQGLDRSLIVLNNKR